MSSKNVSLYIKTKASLREVDKETEAEVEDEASVAVLEAAESHERITRKLEALRTLSIMTTQRIRPCCRVPGRNVTTYVKLPKLEIVKFEGNTLHWRPFRDQ